MKIKKIFLIILFIYLFFMIPSSFALSPSNEPLYNGIDVSLWQGNIDYVQVKGAGIDVVYIRASEGDSYVDPYYLRNYNNAKTNGLKIGFYHYLTATSTLEAQKQADFFVSLIGGLEVDCRLAMDFEQFGNLNLEEINNISFAFLKRVQERSGKEVVIYSDSFNSSNTFSQNLANNYPLWIAEYDVQDPSNNGKWQNWVGFQYTNQGSISGINEYVDLDYFTSDIFLSDTSRYS